MHRHKSVSPANIRSGGSESEAAVSYSCSLANVTLKQQLITFADQHAANIINGVIVVLFLYSYFFPGSSSSLLSSSLWFCTLLWLCNFLLQPFRRALYKSFKQAPFEGWNGSFGWMAKHGLTSLRAVHIKLFEQYGSLCTCFMGTHPVIVVSDANLISLIGSKWHSLFHNRPLLPLVDRALLFERDSIWKAKKAKLQPLFTNHALSFMQFDHSAIEAIRLIQKAVDHRLAHPAPSNPLPPSSSPVDSTWVEFDMYRMMVEQQTHEIVDHCYDIKLSQQEIWEAFPTIAPSEYAQTTQARSGAKGSNSSKIFHVDEHPYVEAIDYFSLHISAFNKGSQALARFWLFPLPYLLWKHWDKVKKGLQSKKIMEYMNVLTEARGQGVKPIQSNSPSVVDSKDSLNKSSTPTLAKEFRELLDEVATGSIFTVSYLQSQLMEVILGTAHTTALILTGVFHHLAEESTPSNPIGPMQRRIQNEIDNLLLTQGIVGQPFRLTFDQFLDEHVNSCVKSIPFIEACIREACRLYTPGGLTREAANDLILTRETTTTNGENSTAATQREQFFIPKGAELHLTNVCHVDPQIWSDNAHFFSPDRWFVQQDANDEVQGPQLRSLADYAFAGEFMPFGMGARKCLGFNYALAHMRYMLIQMMYHFQVRAVVADSSLPVSQNKGYIFPLEQGLVLVPEHPVPMEIQIRQRV